MESVTVQSKSNVEANSNLAVGGDAGAVSEIVGAALSMDANSETSARVTTDSGAEMTAHDNGHGTLVVDAGSEGQYVGLNVSSSATVESEGRSESSSRARMGRKAASWSPVTGRLQSTTTAT